MTQSCLLIRSFTRSGHGATSKLFTLSLTLFICTKLQDHQILAYRRCICMPGSRINECDRHRSQR